MKSQGDINQNLNKTVRFFSSYVYDRSNRSNMITAHSLDVLNISIRVTAPLLALHYLRNDNQLTAGFLLMCPIIAPRALARLKERALAPVTTHVQSQLTAELHKQTFYQPYSQNMNSASGDFAQAIACNYGSVSAFVERFYGELGPFITESATITIVLAVKYETISLIIPSSLFVYALGMARFLIKYDAARKENINTMCQNYGDVLSSISRHKMAKQFNRIEFEQELVQPALDSSELTSQHEEVIRSYANAWGTFIGYSQLLACSIFILNLYLNDQLDIDDALVFVFFSYVIAMLLDNISNSIIDISKACVDAQTIIEFSTKSSSIARSPRPDDLAIETAPSIQFKKVTFSYPSQFPDQPERPILQNLNFTIQPGQTAAFVGKSGVGKSTLTNLLQRLILPKSGSVSISGHKINGLSQTSLYHNIAVVEQGTEFLRGSWYANIAYARKDATESQIVEAAHLAGLISTSAGATELKSHDAGISGHSLSGGEKQRIAIARAILKGGLILVLDEATSALDPETEQQVQTTLNQLSIGVTTLVITHKLYLLSNVDQVFYLKDSGISEHGTCAELINKRGLFYQQLLTQLIEQGNNTTPEAWLASLSPQQSIASVTKDNKQPLLKKNWTPYITTNYFQPPYANQSNGDSEDENDVELGDSRQVSTASKHSRVDAQPPFLRTMSMNANNTD